MLLICGASTIAHQTLTEYKHKLNLTSGIKIGVFGEIPDTRSQVSASKKGQGARDVTWVEFNLFKPKTRRYVYNDGDGLDTQGGYNYTVIVLFTWIIYLQIHVCICIY